MNSISPFTTTPGIAGEAYINAGYADQIIDNFSSEYSTQYVYKLLGQRGSGKSVEYKKVMDYFSTQDNWCVYALASGGDPLQTLLSFLGKELNVKKETKGTVKQTSIEGKLKILKANKAQEESVVTEEYPDFFSAEAELEKMLVQISKTKKVLIGIDDIAATEPMIYFLSVIGKFILSKDINIRLLATGLEKNIEKFVETPHLSFFARPKPFVVGSLNVHDITRMYAKLLNLGKQEARQLAELSKGYAWGYQLLGDIYFEKKDSDTLENVLSDFDSKMAPTYDLIWDSLTNAEKEFIKILVQSETGCRKDIEHQIKGFSQHRRDLQKKHIINTSDKNYITIDYPRFYEYVLEEWI